PSRGSEKSVSDCSLLQKYGDRKSSGSATTLAPLAAACLIKFRAVERFSSGSLHIENCASAMRINSVLTLSLLSNSFSIPLPVKGLYSLGKASAFQKEKPLKLSIMEAPCAFLMESLLGLP